MSVLIGERALSGVKEMPSERNERGEDEQKESERESFDQNMKTTAAKMGE